MKRLLNMRLGLMTILGAVVALGTSARAGSPYLPLIGPTPLRMQVIHIPKVAFAKPSIEPVKAAPAATPTNSPPPTVAKAPPSTSVPQANAIAPVVVPLIPFVPAEPVVLSPESSLGDTFSAAVFPITTPDLLGITPQTLAGYFRPMQIGTNNAQIFDPYRVSFIPPVLPDKSSHAQYIVK